MVQHIADRWVWRRWQLVRVDHLAGDVVLDAIELLDGREEPAAGPVTLVFREADLTSPGETLSQRLERWTDHDDGLCDVFQHSEVPFEVFAMFQGEDSVVAASRPPGDP